LSLSLGFLPHTNAGPLSFVEMRQLKEVNVSLGLMLEQLTPDLLKTVHRYAPSKLPEFRWQQLAMAGELQIPFTTGLLLGIGESSDDWWETLEAIAMLHQRYHHIQEVILQPHSPGAKQSFDFPPFDHDKLPELIVRSRQILPADITIQIPPNLVPDDQWLLACLAAGARDLGGIVPKDEVNPDYHHSDAQQLRKILASAGWELISRLPVYPQFDSWLSPQLQSSVKSWRSNLRLLSSQP
jgi:FO synthase subunit 1